MSTKTFSKILRSMSFAAAVICMAAGADAATYTVVGPEASGGGSLFWAVDSANLNPGADTIDFNIDVPNATTDCVVQEGAGQQASNCCYKSGSRQGVCVIRGDGVTDAHFLLTGNAGVTIDGCTQTGASENTSETAFNGVIRIEIDMSMNSLTFNAQDPLCNIDENPMRNSAFQMDDPNSNDNVIRCLSIYNRDETPAGTPFDPGQSAFTGPIGGVLINTMSDNNRVAGNLLGLRADGLPPVAPEQTPSFNPYPQSGCVGGNGETSVGFTGLNSTIGGTDLADRNVMTSGNQSFFIAASDAGEGPCGNRIIGNCIGTFGDCKTVGDNTQGINATAGCSDAANPNIVGSVENPNVFGACAGSVTASAGMIVEGNYFGLSFDGTRLNTDPSAIDPRGNYITAGVCQGSHNLPTSETVGGSYGGIVAILVTTGQVTARYNVIDGYLGGIDVYETNTAVDGNEFTGNTIRNSDYGIFVQDVTGENTFAGNAIEDNRIGIMLDTVTGHNVFDGNTLSGNGAGTRETMIPLTFPPLSYGGHDYKIGDVWPLYGEASLIIIQGEESLPFFLESADVTPSYLLVDPADPDSADHIHAMLIGFEAGLVFQGYSDMYATLYINDSMFDGFNFAEVDQDQQRALCDELSTMIWSMLLGVDDPNQLAGYTSCDAYVPSIYSFEGMNMTAGALPAGVTVVNGALALTASAEMLETFQAGGIFGSESSLQTVINNTLSGNGTGIRLINSTGWLVGVDSALSTTCQGNTFSDNEDDAIYVEGAGNHIIRCNTFSGLSENEMMNFLWGEGPQSTNVFERERMGSEMDTLTSQVTIGEDVVFDVYEVGADGGVSLSGSYPKGGGLETGATYEILSTQEAAPLAAKAATIDAHLGDAMDQPLTYKITYTTASGGTSNFLMYTTTSYDASGGAGCGITPGRVIGVWAVIIALISLATPMCAGAFARIRGRRSR